MVSTSMIGAEAVHPPYFSVLMASSKFPRIQNMYSESWLSSLILQGMTEALRKPQIAHNKSSLLILALSSSFATSTAF